jgi:protocatechuate 3,4-dioxygenase, beta subunit
MHTRRKILALPGAAGICLAAGTLVRAATASLQRTPSQTLGPFYPVTKPADSDADLTRIEGRRERAQGQVIQVTGRVLNTAGRVLPGVAIELWQANAHGRYDHPGDDNDAPLDPNFQGFARLVTDSQGRYRFKTIKPSGYPAGGFMRPPHIHFSITGKQDRLVTQMYFAGESLNESDSLLARAGSGKDGLIITLGRPTPDLEPDVLLANWDIVLGNG